MTATPDEETAEAIARELGVSFDYGDCQEEGASVDLDGVRFQWGRTYYDMTIHGLRVLGFSAEDIASAKSRIPDWGSLDEQDCDAVVREVRVNASSLVNKDWRDHFKDTERSPGERMYSWLTHDCCLEYGEIKAAYNRARLRGLFPAWRDFLAARRDPGSE